MRFFHRLATLQHFQRLRRTFLNQAGVDPNELAKIKIAFIRNLPSSTDENYLNLVFAPFGKVEKVVVHNKGNSSVGFVHFAQRSHLDNAIEGLNDKILQGPKGGPLFKLQVEVARPMDKKRKRVFEDSFNGHGETLQKQVDKLELNHLPSSLSATEIEDTLVLSGKVHISGVDYLALHVDPRVCRSYIYVSGYSSLYPDYCLRIHTEEGCPECPLQLHELPGSSATTAPYKEDMSPIPTHQIPASSLAYTYIGADFQMRLLYLFAGRPFKFDPFTGEPTNL